jgi:uncharacterized delta-60 repeat protein
MDAKRSAISTIAAAAALALAGGVPAAEAAPGALDPSFGGDGLVVSEPNLTLGDLAVQPDGKVLALHQRIERFLPDGTHDPSFGTAGVAEPLVAPAFWANSLALQPDGKIVVAGYDSAYDFAVARLLPDGKLDPDFDGDGGTGNGIVHTPLTPSKDMAHAVAVDDQGRIVVAGTADQDVGIVRYLPDGKLDKSFAGDGSVVDVTPSPDEDVFALALQDNGMLVAGQSATHTLIARYGKQGAVDTGFGQSGRRTVAVAQWDRAESLAVQSDGTILASLFGGNQGEVLALTPGGDIDQSFGDAGSVKVGGGINSVAVTPGDKVIVGGYGEQDGATGFLVARRNADGSPDSSFAGGGPVITWFHAREYAYAQHVAVAPDGRIVAGGITEDTELSEYEVALARYLVDPDPPADGGSPAAGSGAASGTPQPTPLALSGLKLTNRIFAVARRSTAAVGRAQAAGSRKRGTAFVYTLNRAATVTIRVKRLRARAKPITLKRSSVAGRNRVRFTGRVKRRALRPGVYRATLTAVDASGARSTARTARFRIVR